MEQPTSKIRKCTSHDVTTPPPTGASLKRHGTQKMENNRLSVWPSQTNSNDVPVPNLGYLFDQTPIFPVSWTHP